MSDDIRHPVDEISEHLACLTVLAILAVPIAALVVWEKANDVIADLRAMWGSRQ